MPKKINKLDDELKKTIEDSKKVKNSDDALTILKSLTNYFSDDQIKHKKGNKAGTKRCRQTMQGIKTLCTLTRKLLQAEMVSNKGAKAKKK